MSELEKKVDDILGNHLPTLEKKIVAIDARAAVIDAKVKILLYLNGGVAVAVVAELICGRL